jgi:hypothetical protein
MIESTFHIKYINSEKFIYNMIMKRIKINDYKPSKGRQIADIRSRVTGRTIKFSSHNVQRKTFVTQLFGKISIKLSVRELRTIMKYGSFEGFLLNTKNGRLGDDAVLLKKQMLVKLAESLNIENMARALSHSNAAKTKEKMMDYFQSLYTPSLGTL